MMAAIPLFSSEAVALVASVFSVHGSQCCLVTLLSRHGSRKIV